MQCKNKLVLSSIGTNKLDQIYFLMLRNKTEVMKKTNDAPPNFGKDKVNEALPFFLIGSLFGAILSAKLAQLKVSKIISRLIET